jgi:hypothetical protein
MRFLGSIREEAVWGLKETSQEFMGIEISLGDVISYLVHDFYLQVDFITS